MNWKKIFCKVTEEDKEGEGESFLKFDKFEEVIFQNSGVKCNHMDMGELFKYLEDHQVGYVFKEIFGVEAKSNTWERTAMLCVNEMTVRFVFFFKNVTRKNDIIL